MKVLFQNRQRLVPLVDYYFNVCIYSIDCPKSCKFFWKVFSFYTLYTLSVPPHRPLSTGSSSILGARASRASPGFSIGRTDILVVRTPYIWSLVSVLLYRWNFGLGNRTRDMLQVFWSPHQGAGPFLLDLQFSMGSEPPGARKTLRKTSLVLAGIRTRAAWLAVWHSTHCATALLLIFILINRPI